jgi:hypothetical protein
MPTTTFQTVRLARGKHRSPEGGACVMELASMIAGEPFTDRPRSVCGVIAALLRAYNDLAQDRRRQDLYRCAGDVVGTRASVEVEEARLLHCLAVLDELEALRSRSLIWRLRSPAPSRLRELVRTPTVSGQAVEELLAGVARVLTGGGRTGHARALALVDELVAIGPPAIAPAPPAVLAVE